MYQNPFLSSRNVQQPIADVQPPTADFCDSNIPLLRTGDLRVLQPIFKIYGRRKAFSGPVLILKEFDENQLTRDTLKEENGNGRVLVIDGGGSLRCALLGGELSQLAEKKGWAGVVVNGCIRDVDEINNCDIGVRALASHPIKPGKKGVGERNGVVCFAGARICDGEWLYADGIIISCTKLSVIELPSLF